MINATQISLSGLNAASTRLNVAASNIANANTAGTSATGEAGGKQPYNALTVNLSAQSLQNGAGAGVNARVTEKSPPTQTIYSPTASFADEQGNIAVPNVNLNEEVMNLKLAEITYKANISALKVQNEMQKELLNIKA